VWVQSKVSLTIKDTHYVTHNHDRWASKDAVFAHRELTRRVARDPRKRYQSRDGTK
jgi:hypothetical protein